MMIVTFNNHKSNDNWEGSNELWRAQIKVDSTFHHDINQLYRVANKFIYVDSSQTYFLKKHENQLKDKQ